MILTPCPYDPIKLFRATEPACTTIHPKGSYTPSWLASNILNQDVCCYRFPAPWVPGPNGSNQTKPRLESRFCNEEVQNKFLCMVLFLVVAVVCFRLPDKSLLISVMTYLPPPHQNPAFPNTSTYSLLALGSTDGGHNWKYRGIIGSPQGFPRAEEGPSENGLTVIEGTSRVACVFRLDGGDGHPYHQMLPYGIAFSDDFGATWTKPRMLHQGSGNGKNITVGCACPQLTSIPGGGLLLAGGRPNSHSLDPMVWINYKGDGDLWEPYSISYHHNLGCNYTGPTTWNRTQTTNVFRFSQGVNSSGRPRQSTSYTSLVRTSASSAVLVYSQWLHHMGNQWRAYAMPFQWAYPH